MRCAESNQNPNPITALSEHPSVLVTSLMEWYSRHNKIRPWFVILSRPEVNCRARHYFDGW